MKLIIMTKPTFFVEEDKILSTLFEEGLENLHLYKPHSEPIFSERLLTLLSEDFHDHITVHDHFYLYEEYGLRGIHLSQATDSAPAGFRGHVSRTCHAIDELAAAKKQSAYVILQNIFDSHSNPDDRQSFTLDQLEEASAARLIDKHVYAMGGMDLDTIHVAKELGFGGVVVCGDLWNRFSIHHGMDYKELIAHFDKLRKVSG